MTTRRLTHLFAGLMILTSCLVGGPPSAVAGPPWFISGDVKTPEGAGIPEAHVWFVYVGKPSGEVTSCTSDGRGHYGDGGSNGVGEGYLPFMNGAYDILIGIDKQGYEFNPISNTYPRTSQSNNDIVRNFTGVPMNTYTSGGVTYGHLDLGQMQYGYLNVPPGATEWQIVFRGNGTAVVIPSFNTWPEPPQDSSPMRGGVSLQSAEVVQTLTLNAASNPPLQSGKWYLGVYAQEAIDFSLNTTLVSANPLPTISGTVWHQDGATTIAVAGAVVMADNGATTSTTDAAGQYQITVPYDWFGQVSITMGEARFLPVTRSYSAVTTGALEQNFQGPQYYLNIASDKGNPQGMGWYDLDSTASWSLASPAAGSPGVRYVTTPASGVVAMTGPQTIETHWKTQYFLKTSADPAGSGSVDPSPVWFYAGSSTQVAAHPATNWNFDQFSDALTGSDSPQGLIMDGPKAVVAHFSTTMTPVPTPLPIPGQIRVPGEQPTIQAAIDAAANGNTVLVAPGTYREDINFKGKNITLTSTAPTDPNVVAATIIDGTNSSNLPAVIFSGAELSSCTLTGFTIANGKGYIGGGIRGNGTLATIAYNDITGNSSLSYGSDGTGEGGGIYNCNGLIRNDTITNNTCENLGGGLSRCNGIIENCFVTNNTAHNGGGFSSCDDARIANCVVYENSGVIGGGFYFTDHGTITNCTIYKNHSTSDWGSAQGGGIYCWGGKVWQKNNIVWGNTGQLQSGDPLYTRQVYHGNAAYIANCDIQDWASTDNGCMAADPQFVDPQNDNLQLAPGSPCVDAGTSVSLTEDIRGLARPFNTQFDMGAYEYSTMPAPDAPVIIPEPPLTKGSDNTVSWNPAARAAVYVIQCAASADFAAPLFTIRLPVPAPDLTSYSATFSGLSDGRYWYRVQAENIFGNPGEWSQPTSSIQDETAPWFEDLRAQPPQATVGTPVKITFTASEPLAANPEVQVNGHPTVSVTQQDNQYTYSYTMQADDPLGPATITLSGTDPVGYSASLIDQTALRHVKNRVRDWMLYK